MSLILSAAAVGSVYLCTNLSVRQAAVAFFALYIFSGGNKSVWLIYKTGRRDLVALYRVFKIKYFLWKIKRKNMTVPKYFKTIVQRHPDKAAIIFENQVWTFRDIDEYSNKVANCILQKGLHKNDCIALFMENRPEFIGLWLGFSKAGIVSSLINSNLRHQSLVHSINACKAKVVLCGDEMQTDIKNIQQNISICDIWVTGPEDKILLNADWRDLEKDLTYSETSDPPSMKEGNCTDSMMYIYTSGTTGLPKAAIIKHIRVFYLLDLRPNDIIYNPLPLYHTTGGIIGIGQIGQYVGELCRYLLNAPPESSDKNHKIRTLFGNGMKGRIWEEFSTRFNIPHIGEFYGATENNTSVVNYEGVPKACGFHTLLGLWTENFKLVRINKKTGEYIRDSNGLCVWSKPGEQGEFVSKIVKGNSVRDFYGYTDENATAKTIIRDVFTKGDFAFSSGDIFEMDELGYMYFKDRLGDTFRWRGENVSTTEVEALISQLSNYKDVVVFGVEVPGAEGKAGMAAIADPEYEINLEKLYRNIELNLPSYSRPVFIRILNHIDATGTFKMKKTNLQEEGYDIFKSDDNIFFLHPKQKKYVPLTKDLYEQISIRNSGW